VLENIPEELRARPQWACARANKIPINPLTRTAADVSDPSTWVTFEVAAAAGYPHIGYIVSKDDPFTFIDLDNKPEHPLTESEQRTHSRIIETFDTYTEHSSGGLGFHLVVRGKVPHGAKRGNIEVYSDRRFMICTGNAVRPVSIKDGQQWLDLLYREMTPSPTVELAQVAGKRSDAEILASLEATRERNIGGRFIALWNGDIAAFPSQSEADYELLGMLAFHTEDNEQVRRLFRMSSLGQREKATKNDTYLNTTLRKIRGKQQEEKDKAPVIDFKELTNRALAKMRQEPEQPDIGIPLPPGLVGELAYFMYSSAERSVPEVALAGALALMGGVAGRAYNISRVGLNQYLILLAKTGAGKEGAQNGITAMVDHTRKRVPLVTSYMGPSVFASGQGLVRRLDTAPCFVSVLGEFGITLQTLSDPRASSAEKALKRVLLDLYTKSGHGKVLMGTAYSDVEKNTKEVASPSVTILGESTPEAFFESMDASHVAEGLIPRFTIIEYTGGRPPRNPNAGHPPPPELVERFVALVTLALTMTANNTVCDVGYTPEGREVLDGFDQHADERINAGGSEVSVQLWNRAHLKALKLAALLAVGCDHKKPVIDGVMAGWAVSMVTRDVRAIEDHFRKGDLGSGDAKTGSEIRRMAKEYFAKYTGKQLETTYGVPHRLHAKGIIPSVYFFRRTASNPAFAKHRLGATAALKLTLASLIDCGELIEVPSSVLRAEYGYSGKAYALAAS
jgi:hypothetical protein